MSDHNALVDAWQDLLVGQANHLARQVGLVRRQRLLTGARIAQTLVFSHCKHPAPTQDQMRRVAHQLGATLSRQALAKRFGANLVEFLKLLLAAAVTKRWGAPLTHPILDRFTAVRVLDSSVVPLPEVLLGLFQGGRSGHGRTDPVASAKLTLALDLVNGQLLGPEVAAGRAGDLTASLAQASPPPGGLTLADLNYFSLSKFARWGQDQAFWLSRLRGGTVVRGADGRRWVLADRLRQAGSEAVDEAVTLGGRERLPCRLLALRVPAHVADLRRQRARAKAKDRGSRLSEAKLALCDWTILVTNVPAEKLNVAEAIALCRMRWQIELLFKLWKTGGGLGQWRSHKAESLLIEFYSKLLMLVVRHWVLVEGTWSDARRSLSKGAEVVRSMVPELIKAMRRVSRLDVVLRRLLRDLRRWGRMDRRRRPNAHQMLLCSARDG